MNWTKPYYGVSHLIPLKRGYYVSVTNREKFTDGYILNFNDDNTDDKALIRIWYCGKNHSVRAKSYLKKKAKELKLGW